MIEQLELKAKTLTEMIVILNHQIQTYKEYILVF